MRPRRLASEQINKSFCFFFQKEVLFFFEKKNQKTFVNAYGFFSAGALIASGRSGELIEETWPFW